MTADWAEYLRLIRAGVNAPVAAVLVHEQVRRRPTGGPARVAREHGSERGWRQHRTDGTSSCPDCRAAHVQHNTRSAA